MKVFLIAAISADGFIARETNELANWTSKEDKKLYVELTKRAGVMVMGRTTFETIGRALPGRKTIVYSHQAVDIDGVEVTDEAPANLIHRLHRDGFKEVAVCGGSAMYTQFMEAGVIDELYLTVEPVLFGNGVPLFAGQLDVRLRLLESRQLNDNAVLMHYEVEK